MRRAFVLREDVRRYVSIPQPIAFPTGGGETAHAFYYPPFSPEFAAPADEKAPVLVKSHGGPTSAASSTLSLSTQYWTSRGIGVLDVNYRGSTGYGRPYRLRLERQWGLVDVEDCVAGARWLVKNRNADPERLMISGGSAGGYTTLCALTPKAVLGDKETSAIRILFEANEDVDRDLVCSRDQDLPRLGGALKARSEVRRLACHLTTVEDAASGKIADDHAAARDADARLQPRADGRLEAFDPGNRRKTGANRALGVIFIGDRPAEIGEHAIAQKLRHIAAVALDRARDGFLAEADKLVHLLCIQARRQARGLDHVAKEDAEQPEVGTGRARRLDPAGKEQAALIGAPNQVEAIRSGVEKRPARFVDPD